MIWTAFLSFVDFIMCLYLIVVGFNMHFNFSPIFIFILLYLCVTVVGIFVSMQCRCHPYSIQTFSSIRILYAILQMGEYVITRQKVNNFFLFKLSCIPSSPYEMHIRRHGHVIVISMAIYSMDFSSWSCVVLCCVFRFFLVIF